MVKSRVPSFSDHLLWCKTVFSISVSVNLLSFLFGYVLGDLVGSILVHGDSVHVESKSKNHKNDEENDLNYIISAQSKEGEDNKFTNSVKNHQSGTSSNFTVSGFMENVSSKVYNSSSG